VPACSWVSARPAASIAFQVSLGTVSRPRKSGQVTPAFRGPVNAGAPGLAVSGPCSLLTRTCYQRLTAVQSGP
jgi:hypothetical protein